MVNVAPVPKTVPATCALYQVIVPGILPTKFAVNVAVFPEQIVVFATLIVSAEIG